MSWVLFALAYIVGSILCSCIFAGYAKAKGTWSTTKFGKTEVTEENCWAIFFMLVFWPIMGPVFILFPTLVFICTTMTNFFERVFSKDTK